MTVFVHDGVSYHWRYSVGDMNNCASRFISDVILTTALPDVYGNVPVTGPVPSREVLDAFHAHLYKHIKAATGNTQIGTKVICFVGPVDFQSEDGGPSKSNSAVVTHDFVDWLIRTKTGTVIASPIFANTTYGKDPASLNQMWIWIPPHMYETGRVLPDTGGIFNEINDDKTVNDFATTVNPYTTEFSKQFSQLNDAPITRYAKAGAKWDHARKQMSIRKRSLRWTVGKLTRRGDCDTVADMGRECCPG